MKTNFLKIFSSKSIAAILAASTCICSSHAMDMESSCGDKDPSTKEVSYSPATKKIRKDDEALKWTAHLQDSTAIDGGDGNPAIDGGDGDQTIETNVDLPPVTHQWW